MSYLMGSQNDLGLSYTEKRKMALALKNIRMVIYAYFKIITIFL